MTVLAFCSCAYAECAYFDEHGDHDWIYGETKATCETSGASFRDCSICGLHENVSTVSAAGHSWVEGSTPADCENPGETYRDCSVCGAHETTGAIDALGHSWTVNSTAADCTTEGGSYQECSTCGTREELTSEEALGHDWREYTTQPTCEAPGETYRICDRCELRETISTQEALGHDWVENRIEATCEQAGELYRQCSRCDNRETLEVIEAISHLWTDREILGEATCENDGAMRMTCSNCGETKTYTIPATGHDYGQWETTKEATCTAEGEKTGKCYNCGETIEEIIPRTEHEYGEWEITIEATDNSMGKRLHRCTVCGASAEEMYYPDGTLYRGMHKNDAVVEMQEKLTALGILNDKADGIFGKKTEQAVIDFQTLLELEPTGIAYPETLSAINEAMAVAGIEEASTSTNEPAYCMHVTDADGIMTVVYCGKHAALVEETAALFIKSDAVSEDYADIKNKWQTELSEIYAAWLKKADVSIQPLIEASEAEFINHLTAQEALFSACCSEAPEKAAIYAIELLMEQCAYICEHSAITE